MNLASFISFFFFLLSDPVDHGSWHFDAGSCGSCILWTCILFLRSCRCWIFKVCSIMVFWVSWILRILDPNFVLYHRILEILDFDDLVLKWDLWDPGPQNIDIWWDPGDIGSWLSHSAVGSCRSWILTFYFVVRSCGSWILIFDCGTCLYRIDGEQTSYG